jgi:FkbH-like protein
MMMKADSKWTFSDLKKNLKKDFDKFPEVKVCVLGDAPTQLLAQALKGYGFLQNINYNIREADFDQIDRQLLDPASETYEFNPDFIIVYNSLEKLQQNFYKTDKLDKAQFASTFIQHLESLFSSVNRHASCRIIYLNFPESLDGIYGNYANNIDYSFLYQIRKINLELMNMAIMFGNLSICDVSVLSALLGKQSVFSATLYINSNLTFSLDFLPLLVKNMSDIMLSARGSFHKCIILDLDNTTWGGIIGDDGIENIQIGDLGIGKAFIQLQYWVIQLKQRGIIVCVCSKNNEDVAREPFEKHPDMILKMDDISVFMANWETKADNIRAIQAILNIGFDSMVFLDDNPFEREFVKKEIPSITVPDLPEDPAEYLLYLQSLNLFEISALSAEDEKRTKQYQEDAKRAVIKKGFTNEEEFLRSLEMVSEVNSFDKFSIPRVAQLTQRSNQFNLRTIRYSESDVEMLMNDKNALTFSYHLEDKYGQYGLISVVVLKKVKDKTLTIDNWLMSCRVLKRGMEKFVLNTIVDAARKNGFEWIEAEYIPTAKNSMVADHYKKLGFDALEKENHWQLNVGNYSKFEVYIQKSKA